MALVEGWPWPLRTLLLVAALVPVVVLVAGPRIDAFLSRLERRFPGAPKRALPTTDPY